MRSFQKYYRKASPRRIVSDSLRQARTSERTSRNSRNTSIVINLCRAKILTASTICSQRHISRCVALYIDENLQSPAGLHFVYRPFRRSFSNCDLPRDFTSPRYYDCRKVSLGRFDLLNRKIARILGRIVRESLERFRICLRGGRLRRLYYPGENFRNKLYARDSRNRYFIRRLTRFQRIIKAGRLLSLHAEENSVHKSASPGKRGEETLYIPGDFSCARKTLSARGENTDCITAARHVKIIAITGKVTSSR